MIYEYIMDKKYYIERMVKKIKCYDINTSYPTDLNLFTLS